jgi:hypothetical protein
LVVLAFYILRFAQLGNPAVMERQEGLEERRPSRFDAGGERRIRFIFSDREMKII